ncbi:MAG TPA: right-handed parallel beta-helix repeat-containing protein [Vicinamibacterales bacterium]|nr:right-handed parallel beta-helix repeat-containing protein [Vicinamibacterales bacterium]
MRPLERRRRPFQSAKRAVILLVALCAGTVTAALQRAPAVIAVPAGGNLQDAIDRAQPGDTIALERGAEFVGNFVLPVKDGSAYITIRTEGDVGLPAPTQRIEPSSAPLLAKLRSPSSEAVLRTSPGAHHWRLQLLEFDANKGGFNDIILLGDGSRAQNDLALVPHDLVVDRCYVHGDPVVGQKRGIALNSASTTISNSYIADIKANGQDSQAVAGWNGPGPFVLENNYLEAAGENFLLGGADPSIRDLVPSDVTFVRNDLSKPLDWRGSKWQVKNLFELKNARRVLVEGNVFENNWQAAQSGFAILLTPRNSDGTAPWAAVEDVTFHSNVVRHVAAVFNVLGMDHGKPSGLGRRIQMTNNLFEDVSGKAWGGNGIFLQVGDGPSDITVDHNTILQTGNLISAYGGTRDSPKPIVGFVFTNNLARHNAYGVAGAGRSPGNDSLSAFFPGVVFTHNVLAGGRASRYPGGNLFPSLDDFEKQFVNPTGGDYHLVPDSPLRHAATDGDALGADLQEILRAAGPNALKERHVTPKIIKGASDFVLGVPGTRLAGGRAKHQV